MPKMIPTGKLLKSYPSLNKEEKSFAMLNLMDIIINTTR
jgi:hypothetical protein